MFETDRNCPRCSDSGFVLLAQVSASAFCEANSTYRRDWARLLGLPADARFPLCRCRSCGFVFAGWRPSKEFLSKVYDEVIDADIGFRESIRSSWVAHQARISAFALDELELRHGLASRPLRVLDIGCSYGNQLQILRVAGFEVLGVDTSPRVQAHLARVGVPFEDSVEKACGRGPFDLILLNEVLEHLPDFRTPLRAVRTALREDGIAWISVPDFSEWRLDKALRELRQGERPVRELNLWEHLNYFTPRALREIALEEGFKPCARSHAIEGLTENPGWKNPIAALRLSKSLMRWLLKGAHFRTDLLVEKA